jgi:predicted aconitase with swiveling domain
MLFWWIFYVGSQVDSTIIAVLGSAGRGDSAAITLPREPIIIIDPIIAPS